MTTQTIAEQEKGAIGRVHENGLPVIYKFVNEIPSASMRNQLQLALPLFLGSTMEYQTMACLKTDENQRMISLENIIEKHIENDKVLCHVYSRTGNNLKELVYYIHDQKPVSRGF